MSHIRLEFSPLVAHVESAKVLKAQALKSVEELSLTNRTEAVAKARFVDAHFALTPTEREGMHALLTEGSKAQSLKVPIDHGEAYEVACSINEFLVQLTIEDHEAGEKAWHQIPKIHQMWIAHHAKRNGADISKIWECEAHRDRAICAAVGYMLSLEMSIQPEVYPDRAESEEVIARLDATGS